MKSRYTVVTALLGGVMFASAAGAHDFWIQPQQYWSQPDASIPITLQVGHGAERQRSQIRSSRISRFVAFAPDGTLHDVRSELHLRGASDDGQLRFDAPGAYVIVLETDNGGRSALPAHRFNDYARDEGLAPALDYRERAGKLARPDESVRRRSGTWLLNVVWTQPAAVPADVDFDTTFSSLTFGFP